MNKKEALTIGTLPAMWIVYILFELFTGRITNIETLIFNIFLVFLFALTGYIIYRISLKYKDGFKKSTIFYLFIISLVLDQGIKLLIKLFCFNTTKAIIPNMLYFSPIINTDGSWLNARFGTSVSFPLLITVNIVAIFLFIEIYRYYEFNRNKDFWSDMCFVFILSGALCSLIDKVFYGGSLDFIGINNLFIADIKDIYINLGILFFVLTLFNNGYLTNEEDTTFKDDINSIKEFLVFIKNDIFRKTKK